jgi:uncharacterized membrane protein
VRPLTLEEFLPEHDRTRVKEAVATAELGTSAEVRVHLDEHCEDEELDRAAFLFAHLDMHRTALRNGVLLYVNVSDRRVAVIGDAGIHRFVGQSFWDDVIELIRLHFIGGRYAEGIIAGVERIAVKLREHFPRTSDDRNELSDEVSLHR